MNSVWLNLRAYPWRRDHIGLFVGLMVGPSWENASATGTHPATALGDRISPYRCSASGSVDVAFGASAGLDLDLGSGLALLARVGGTSYRASSGILTDGGSPCAFGLGSATVLDARAAIAYRFDLTDVVGSRTTAKNIGEPLRRTVVRRLFGDDHVVHVALAEALRRDADELAPSCGAPRSSAQPV